MERFEKRKHQRHDIKLEVLCRKIGLVEENFFSGHTVNISTGGMLAHTKSPRLSIGDFLNVQLSVPPADGMLEFGGRFEGFAKVVRVSSAKDFGNDDFCRQLIALQFCTRPKLSV